MMKGLRIAGFLAVIALLASCNAGQAWQKRTIANKENTIMEEAKKGKIDTSGVKSLLVAYDAFVKQYPLDTNSANYLFKEADFYRYLHQPKKSVEIYAGIYNNYPQYFKRPYALFMQGFFYEKRNS
jgi:hypothetical protein